jgi:threonine/homoserine/homoserine lactone efflux protein
MDFGGSVMASRESMFRRHHRKLAVLVSLPLMLMAITGLVSPLLEALNFQSAAELVRRVHSGKILLGSAYIIYTGLTAVGLLWLLFTGLQMLRGFGRGANIRKQAPQPLSVEHRRK